MLRELAASGSEPKGRLHALWTLAGQEALDEATLVAVLGDPCARLREQALRLPIELEPGQREALTRLSDAALVERAKRLLAASAPAQRDEVIRRYQAGLKLSADRRRGGVVFVRHCRACHALRGVGHRVGPDLAGAAADPNRQVAPDQMAYVATTEDGQIFTGLLVAETPSGITLRRAEGQETTVARSQIDELRASGKSLMPEGLEQQLSPHDVADLLEFLIGGDTRALTE